MTRRALAFALALLIVGWFGSVAATAGSAPHHGTVGSTAAVRTVPHFAHIIVVIEENHSYSDIIGNADAPYFNQLAQTGTSLTNSFGVTHPSQPNYVALFSGSTHGLTDDSCPHTYPGNNLAHQLLTHGQTFVGYAESLPHAGDTACIAGRYARKHAPWTDFSNVPTSLSKPLRAFPSNYAQLPRLSFVVPNLDDDMHDGTISQADTWLHHHLGAYARWARTHNSLLVVTWDEDDRSANNHIPGMLAGAHVRQMNFAGHVDHYRMLRTIEAACGLPAIGAAVHTTPITAVWTR